MSAERLFSSHNFGTYTDEELDFQAEASAGAKVTGNKWSLDKEQAKEAYRSRSSRLSQSGDLDEILATNLEEREITPPEKINLSLKAVQEFQDIARQAQDFRKVSLFANDPVEKAYAALLYSEKKDKLDEYLELGDPFERAYREYIKSQNQYLEFSLVSEKIATLEKGLAQPSFSSLDASAKLDERAHARVEMAMRQTDVSLKLGHGQEIEDLLFALRLIYHEGSPEYQKAAEELQKINGADLPRSKGEIGSELTRLRRKAHSLWQDPMVRYIWQRNEYTKMIEAFSRGEDVIENQSVIGSLNAMHEWEIQHPRTTIGGVLVGPPGVGKTTIVRHYLEAKKRSYIYIDLSEDVTRYMLYGSKSLEMSSTDHHEDLIEKLDHIDESEFRQMVAENGGILQRAYGLDKDEALVAALNVLDESLEEGKEGKEDEKVATIQGRIKEIAHRAFRAELAQDFAHLVKKNGWRDGVIISALRRGDSVILDEFNKNKNWSLIYGLMTAKPGEEWYFADNDEYIKIPEDWRMYFTGNIGRKHGGFVVAEALASRAGGKVMNVDYPKPEEEMRTALMTVSDAEGNLLRSKEDLAKLYYLIFQVFPKIRLLTEDKQQAIPISYRTLRDLGEKLILYQDPKTNQPVYQATGKTFDAALYEVLVESYGLYEDKTIPKEVVNVATSHGLLLDKSVEAQVVGWLDKDEFENRKKSFDEGENKKNFNEIVDEIRGIQSGTHLSASTLPIPRSF